MKFEVTPAKSECFYVVTASKQTFRGKFVVRSDTNKAKSAIGWKPEVKFDRLIEMMVQADIDKLA